MLSEDGGERNASPHDGRRVIIVPIFRRNSPWWIFTSHKAQPYDACAVVLVILATLKRRRRCISHYIFSSTPTTWAVFSHSGRSRVARKVNIYLISGYLEEHHREQHASYAADNLKKWNFDGSVEGSQGHHVICPVYRWPRSVFLTLFCI